MLGGPAGRVNYMRSPSDPGWNVLCLAGPVDDLLCLPDAQCQFATVVVVVVMVVQQRYRTREQEHFFFLICC